MNSRPFTPTKKPTGYKLNNSQELERWRAHKETGNKQNISFIFTPGLPQISPLTALTLAFFIAITHAASEENKLHVMKAICTNSSVKALNKPDIILAAQDGIIMPVSCWGEPNCAAMYSFLDYYKYQNEIVSKIPNSELFYQLRNQKMSDRLYQKSQLAFEKRLEKAIDNISKLDSGLKKYFDSIVKLLEQLRTIDCMVNIMTLTKIGNCGEQNFEAVRLLLFKKIQYGLQLKIQWVLVDATSVFNTNAIKEHSFLILDSEIGDCNIVNDPQLVTKKLSEINSAYLCDRYNRIFGKMSELNSPTKSLYLEGKWLSMRVETLENFNASRFSELPRKLRKLICIEFKNVGLPFEYHPKECSSFLNKKNTLENQVRENHDENIKTIKKQEC